VSDALRYYATTLSGEERKAYYAMEEGFADVSRSIRLPRLAYGRLQELMTMVKYDHPAYFYVGTPSFRAVPTATHVEMLPSYHFAVKEIPSLVAAADKRLSRVLAPAEGMTDPEKVRFVWEFIRDHVTYEKLTRNYSHEIYGVLFHGIGVCEGIAKTVKVMLDRLSVESLVVLGDTGEDGVRHAWNVIWLYGKPRHYDFTFDLSLVKAGRNPYYRNLSDDAIFRDHSPSVFPIPVCC